jgi:hypothetical protein
VEPKRVMSSFLEIYVFTNRLSYRRIMALKISS